MSIPPHRLTPRFEDRVLRALSERGVDLEEPSALALSVKALSDFYIESPGRATPWEEPESIAAYLAYFQTLNFVRLRSVFQEVKRFLPWSEVREVWDFGSGLGTTQWVLESEDSLEPRPLYAFERSKRAREIHGEWSESSPWNVEFPSSAAHPGRGALAVFSYSFLEMQNDLPDLNRFAHLLILEPSFQKTGRELMAWRAKLLKQGFHALAPCTHAEACPLLEQSPRDWCHMRIHFSPPDWFARLEAHLPMKNRTLTYSYLLMSRDVEDSTWRGAARAIGDTLREKGKTRQMICRGPKREFLSWLHKHGEAPEIPHGALIRGVENAEEKGGELRSAPDSLTWEV